ncbi:MAG TPA: hypothetical protein VL463_18325 [Kofleriaceae bacterium]|jgi:hypothetical protein|nr:hypothetical protein [Kofleriaceae bacterium]
MKSLLILIAIGASAHAGTVRHVPPSEATAGEPLQLIAQLGDNADSALVVRYRALGVRAWSNATFTRREDREWIAEIPADAIAPPGLEYFLVDGDHAALGSESWPVEVAVHRAPEAERADRDLARVLGRRSRVHVMTEWIDYGARTIHDRAVDDHYYRVDADFSYALLAYPLEQLRFGYTRLVGTTPDDGGLAHEAGFKVAGWFELGFGIVEGVRFDARGIVAATQGGFALGTRAEVRLGDADRTHVATGLEYLADVGATGYFRLGWATVPGAPMAVTIEGTDLPSSDRATGVRLLYDIAHPFEGGLRVGARVGYAARDQSAGGISAGLGASFDF